MIISNFKTINYKSIFVFSILLVNILYSCQKEVHINLGSSPPALVVEGQIQTGQPPIVVLTTTIGFFSSINLTTLEGSFVTNATVTVSNGTKTVTLKEYSIDTTNSNKVYVYSIDTTGFDTSKLLLGEEGKFYTLTIYYNGNIYKGITKIPTAKGVDSMWFDKPKFPGKKTPDSAKEMFVNYKDPDSLGNYVRVFTKINNQNFYPTAIYSDQAVNGILISKIGVYAGFLDSVNVKTDTAKYFYPGDTVTVNWCQIDKAVYNFWNSEDYANQVLGNPFASPINIITNMNNGAIGVWAGYSTATTTKVVP